LKSRGPFTDDEPAAPGVVSRRALLGGIGAAGAFGAGALLFGACSSDATPSGAPGTSSAVVADSVPFFGAHQAGIATPSQDRLLFGAFDILTTETHAVQDLLSAWTAAAADMTQGQELGNNNTLAAPADDTGEALGLPPSKLTITIGFGPTFFEQHGVDRFGVKAKRPAALAPLPAFAGDNLDPQSSDGDLGVQVCADDPQVAFHALRNLTRIGKGTVGLRWSQLGFGRTSGHQSGDAETKATPRNLLGFKDGTNNIVGTDLATMNEDVWVGAADGPAWMHGGAYVVTRRINMRIEIWDRNSLGDQEQTIGRAKASGAPLGAHGEFDLVPLTLKDKAGALVIDPLAHIRLAAPSENGGIRILRRGYSFTDGVDLTTANLEAGLFFIAYMRDPRKQFVPLQHHLAGKTHDRLNEYIQHTGSAVFAVPPGVREGHFIGEGLFR
jgi:deferrochelatase/peroxidase EfeB